MIEINLAAKEKVLRLEKQEKQKNIELSEKYEQLSTAKINALIDNIKYTKTVFEKLYETNLWNVDNV